MSDDPTHFERFEVVRTLGRGGMGTVYLARDRVLDRLVAVKVLSGEGLTSEERTVRFLREARTAGAVRHPNVATIYEADETEEGQPFIVMEYCDGETLSQRMRRRPLDTGEFLLIARQIAAGLAAAHAEGVVHRDIKAANVILEASGVVKILDFGLAKLLPREHEVQKQSFETTSGQFFGTLHYVSPEQARGLAADARSDLFSAGVVFYQMASGHLPFNADSALLTLEKIRDAEPEPFTPIDPAFPVAATRVISRLLQKNPADRYQTAAQLLADLEAIEAPTARSRHQSKSGSLGRTIPRPRLRRLLMTAAALVALIAAAVYMRTGPDPQPPPSDPAGPIRSLAVLPLQNLAGNEKDEFLSVGLADALVTRLQKIPSLQVRPTSSVLEFRKERPGAKEAASRLQVDGILEGHFLSAGDMVRVNIQLTDGRTGYSVWGDSVDGRRDDLLEVIDTVTARTAEAMNSRLGVKQPPGTVSEARSSNPKAYEEFLRARALTGSFEQSEFTRRIEALRRAIALDPKFAAAYADLAVAISLGIARSQISEPDALQKAEWYARQAVRLDPNLPESHLALGRVFVRHPGRFREAVRENLAALRLNPNAPQALWAVATYFVSTGEIGKLRCVTERLVRVDPHSNEAKTRGYWFVNAVDAEGAHEHAKAALAAKDTELAGHDIRGVAFLLQGNVAEAEREAEAATRISPDSYFGKSLRALIAAARNDRAACEAAISTFEADARRNHWAAIRIAQCYAKLGDRDRAIAWLEQAAALGNHSWYALIKHPWLQGLQADPAFQSVVGKIKADLDDVQDDVIGVYNLLCE